MKTRLEWCEFVCENYRLGIDITGYGEFYPCKTCGAIVYHSDDALERHVKWHEEVKAGNAR